MIVTQTVVCDHSNEHELLGYRLRKLTVSFAEFSESQLGERVHAALIEKYETPRLVGHISRDSTEIEGRERAAKKVKKTEELPKQSDSDQLYFDFGFFARQPSGLAALDDDGRAGDKSL